MLITDPPELMNLQEDQAPSTESLIAPSQPQNHLTQMDSFL